MNPMIEGENLTRILQNNLRSPVSGILSLAQLILLEGGGNPDLREYAQNIYDRGQRMLTVMDNLVDLDRIEHGAFQLRREPLVVNTLVEQILKDYERALKLKGVTARLRIQGLAAGSAPLLTYWGKESLLWGIVENAFRNAVEASSSGTTIEIKVDLKGDALVVELDNTGEVPFEFRDRFFDPFLTSKPEGVGIGTYVMKSFAKALEGDASVTTGQGRTSVRVELPQREGQLDGAS
jgi:signal transduction histidine kinase